MTTPKIRYLLAHYGFGPDHPYIAVPDGARSLLEEMGATIAGTDGLVGIYIPEGTKDVYEPGTMRGRVVGAVRLLAMPHGRSVEDYFYRDIDQSRRWPFGWPCEVVYAPAVVECPVLRELVASLWGSDTNFGGFVKPLKSGPIKLDRYKDLQARLSSDMARLSVAPES